ncbi:MAG: hypothetical protein KDK62_06590 [Chlamydiia bacterium]|nr:hypothetical protein [Chlamydiia bacterium]
MSPLKNFYYQQLIQPANDFRKKHGTAITVSVMALAIFSTATYAGLRRFNFSTRQSTIAGVLCGLVALVEGFAMTSIAFESDNKSKRAFR